MPATRTRFHPATWLFAFAMVLLAGCASLPDDLQQIPSKGYANPEQTLLGALIAETAPEDKSLSGVQLLANPGKAFRAAGPGSGGPGRTGALPDR
jgi:hypothetical protein